MNQLITDISNFTRLKAEIELEKNEYIKINDFLDEIPKIINNAIEKHSYISNPSIEQIQEIIIKTKNDVNKKIKDS